MKVLLRAAALILFATSLASLAHAQEVGAFEVHLDSEAFAELDECDLFIAFAERGEPRQRMHAWFGAPPLLRFRWKRETMGERVTLSVDQAAAWHPLDWIQVEPGTWSVQAVARLSRTGRQAGLDPGDVISEAIEIEYDTASTEAITLRLDSVVEPEPFTETERARLFEFVSPALSKFHGFDYTMRAGVLLPIDYDENETYPVLYSITGFGGTHEGIVRWERGVQEGNILSRCIIVIPDASNRYGHSAFCDSRSIGPWGSALVHELIPALEAKFGGAGSEQRYVTGGSSGGWSSLWLQVAYPDDFAGCWSHVPDPIDFHDFQQVNLYEPLEDGSPRNMFTDEAGGKRPLARRGGEVTLTYEDFAQRENVLNPGGQLRSFDATFSPLAADGTPRRVFDVETGVIDHEVARAWRQYDISHLLLTRWDELRGSLRGKVHVYAGEVDTFYLEGAVERFRALAEEAGILEEMVVEVIPGMAHSSHGPGQENMLKTIELRMGGGE